MAAAARARQAARAARRPARRSGRARAGTTESSRHRAARPPLTEERVVRPAAAARRRPAAPARGPPVAQLRRWRQIHTRRRACSPSSRGGPGRGRVPRYIASSAQRAARPLSPRAAPPLPAAFTTRRTRARRRRAHHDRAARGDRLEREPGGARGRVGRRAAPRGEPGVHSAGRPHALQDSQVVVRVCRASGSSTHPRVGGALVFEMHSPNDCHTLRSCPGWRP